jgi:hypothetical protein
MIEELLNKLFALFDPKPAAPAAPPPAAPVAHVGLEQFATVGADGRMSFTAEQLANLAAGVNVGAVFTAADLAAIVGGEPSVNIMWQGHKVKVPQSIAVALRQGLAQSAAAPSSALQMQPYAQPTLVAQPVAQPTYVPPVYQPQPYARPPYRPLPRYGAPYAGRPGYPAGYPQSQRRPAPQRPGDGSLDDLDRDDSRDDQADFPEDQGGALGVGAALH